MLLNFQNINNSATILPGSKQNFIKSSSDLNLQRLQIWMWAAIIIGIGLRLFHFFYNRSLWTDEVYLCNSLIRMDFLQLTAGPLEYQQKAPLGFLWMERLSVIAFGKGEMALRLFPLLCGIASLFVFRSFARYVLSPLGVVIGLAILAVGPPLVYHSVEAKQYGTELLSTLLALHLYFRYHQQTNIKSLIIWGLWGSLLLWFSYPAIFILGGMAVGTCVFLMWNKNWKTLFLSLIPFSLWLISFVVNYFLFTYKHTNSEWLIIWFSKVGSFMPFPPTSLKELKWFLTMPFSMLHFALGLSWVDVNYEYSTITRGILRFPFLPLFCWLAGTAIIYQENRKLFWVMVLPFLLTMIASGLKMYPMFERLMVFLAPLLIIFIVRGCEGLLKIIRHTRWQYAVITLLLAGAVFNSASMAVQPSQFGRHFKNMKAKDALLYANEHFQKGDVVYVYWNFLPFYRYYKEAYNLKYEAKISSVDARFKSLDRDDYIDKLEEDFSELSQARRFWFIYNKHKRFVIGEKRDLTHWYNNKKIEPGTLVEKRLSSMGKRIDYYNSHEVSLSLFAEQQKEL